MARQVMSMEAALDEERLNVLELLEGLNNNNNHGTRAKRGSGSSVGSRDNPDRTSSPYPNPRSPIRSMLDIDADSVPRHSSIAGTNAGITSPPRPSPVRSMLDVGPTPAPSQPAVRSMLDVGSTRNSTSSFKRAQMSPAETNHRARSLNKSIHPRSLSDAATRPSNFGPRASVDQLAPPKTDKTAGFQFSGILTNNLGGPSVKRNTQGGKKDIMTPNAMAEAVRGELGYLPGERGGHSKSRSPSNRLALRSSSPAGSFQSGSYQGSKLGQLSSKVLQLDDGTLVDINSAYRRLSDANLALSHGSLAKLPQKARRRTTSGDGGSGRLEKDPYALEEDDAVMESSDDDSDEEAQRGRRKGRADEDNTDPESQTIGMGRAKGPRTALSLMAAAEEERQQIAKREQHKYQVRSLLEPEITVTGPGGDRLKTTKPGVRPTNAFDFGGVSGVSTPVTSDEEADISDIRRAQKLSLIMTPVTSSRESHRCVRTIYRGDFVKMQKEAEEEHRRVRKYLVATDLSDEAAHALEWTIGTVLRDGDTLLAIYCIDEETGIITAEGEAPAPDSQAFLAQVASVGSAANKPQPPTVPGAKRLMEPSPLASSSTSRAYSPSGRQRTSAEQERQRAVDDITERVNKLLRKTRLQVRVVIEVIHCKSPKHLICEVIDYINPTLVILGSRGRSALKGVILGSFSNYLVTKSSVPVMVARKRLRKHGKYKRPTKGLVNNLTSVSGKSLAAAKID